MKKFCAPIVLLFLLTVVAFAQTDQPMSDKVVGYWVSSSGTPLNIAYSGDPVYALLQIQGGSDIKLWLAGGARGGISLDYTSRDGTKMRGKYNDSDDTISIWNPNSNYKATWRRR